MGMKSLMGLPKTHCAGDSYELGSGAGVLILEDGMLQGVSVKPAIWDVVVSDEPFTGPFTNLRSAI